MQYAWYDFVGTVGVALILAAYVLLQTERIRNSDFVYSLMNAAGALAVAFSLLYRFNVSAFIVELFWFLISVYGLIKFAARSKARTH
jgi:hypothetical protein